MKVKINELCQARREPQRGPRKHYCGALSPHPILYVLRSRRRRRWDFGIEREETWGEVCPHHPTKGSGSVISSPSRVPAENGLYAYFRSERSHLEHHFQYFWATAGPPNVAGPGKTPPFPPHDGPELRIWFTASLWHEMSEWWLITAVDCSKYTVGRNRGSK